MSELSFRDLLIGTWTSKGDDDAKIVLKIKDDSKFTWTDAEEKWLDL
jgi:hypothetical protein